jgi:hypothetical protein
MRHANIETVQRACDVWNGGDISQYAGFYAPSATAYAGELWPEGTGVIEGCEAIIAAFESIRSAFERSELVPLGFAGDDERLVVPVLMRGTPANASATVEQRLVLTYRFAADGRIAHQGFYRSVDAALAALELPADLALELTEGAGLRGPASARRS